MSSSSERAQHVLDSIDGALADAEFPDAMRWSPEPEQVDDASDLHYDGDTVPQPPQRYEPSALDRTLHPERVYVAPYRAVIVAPTAVTAAAEYERMRSRLQIGGASIDGVGIEDLPACADCRCEMRPVFDAARPLLSDDAIASIRLHAQQSGRPADLALREALLLQVATDPEALGRTMDRIVEAARPVFVELGRIFTELGRAVSAALPKIEDLRQTFIDAGAHPEQPPSDPRARALWLRQHRNTGPAQRRAQHAHAPRWHDGRR